MLSLRRRLSSPGSLLLFLLLPSTTFSFLSLLNPTTNQRATTATQATLTEKSRQEYTESLCQHLEEGPSTLDDNLSIVALSPDECGIRYDSTQNNKDNDANAQQQQQQPQPPQQEEEEIVLAYIDRQEFISPRKGKETPFGKALAEYFEQHTEDQDIYKEVLPSIYVALFLCDYQVHKSSNNNNYGKYDKYLRTLPTLDNLRHLPVFWSDDSLQFLKGSEVLEAVLRRRQAWKQEYNIIGTAIRHFNNNNKNKDKQSFVDWDTYCWARSILTSRGFQDNKTQVEEGEEICMVPYIDMLNHCSSDQQAQDADGDVIRCEWRIRPDGFVLTKKRTTTSKDDDDDDEQPTISNAQNSNPLPLSSSSSVEISYGSHSNAVMLMNYGFTILDDNHQTKLDRARVSLTLPIYSMMYDDDKEQKGMSYLKELWEKDGQGDCYTEKRHIVLNIATPDPMKTLLSYCRVASCQSKSELLGMFQTFMERRETHDQELDDDDDGSDGYIPAMAGTLARVPYSQDNEIRALQLVQKLIQTQLCQYDTALAEDEMILSEQQRDEDGGKSSSSSPLPLPSTDNDNNNPLAALFSNVLFPLNNADEDLLKDTNRRNAIVLRRGEKRVLQHYYNLATMLLHYFEQPDSKFEEYPDSLQYYLEGDEPILQPGLI